MASLRRRLGIGITLSLIAVLLVQWLLVSVAIRRVTEGYVASRLAHDAETLVAALRFPDGEPRVAGARLASIYLQPYSGHYYRIRVEDAVVRSRSLWDQDFETPALAPGVTRRLHRTGPQGQPLLVRVEGFRKQGREVTVAVAEDLSSIAADIAGFRWAYALVSAAALAVLIVLQGVIVTRGLRPLEALRRQVLKLTQGEVQTLDAPVPAEVRPLVDALNRLLEIMRRRLARYRSALGNLAHALKTPLTLLGQQVDDEPDAARRESMRAQVARIRTLMDRELKRARLAGGGAGGARVDLTAELETLVETLRSIHRERAVELRYEAPPGRRYPADREDMLELLGNLLDNACKWARSRVRVRVDGAPGLEIAVEDDGPGASAQALRALTERGRRVDESVTGHGLGLGIVRDVVEQYGGELRFDRSADLGGLQVVVRLPAPADAW